FKPGLAFSKHGFGDEDFDPRIATLVIDRAIAGEIEKIGSTLGADRASVLLTCWQILISRLVAGDGVAIGAAFDGRKYELMRDALGLFTRYLPIHYRSDEDSAFSETLAGTQESLQEAYRCQEYFTWQDLGVAPGNHEPFHWVCFEYEEHPASLR